MVPQQFLKTAEDRKKFVHSIHKAFLLYLIKIHITYYYGIYKKVVLHW